MKIGEKKKDEKDERPIPYPRPKETDMQLKNQEELDSLDPNRFPDPADLNIDLPKDEEDIDKKI